MAERFREPTGPHVRVAAEGAEAFFPVLWQAIGILLDEHAEQLALRPRELRHDAGLHLFGRRGRFHRPHSGAPGVSDGDVPCRRRARVAARHEAAERLGETAAADVRVASHQPELLLVSWIQPERLEFSEAGENLGFSFCQGATQL